MKIDTCPNNVRCFVANCNNFATANIDTNGFKGSICLCDNCFKDLLNEIKSYIKKQKQAEETKVDNSIKKRK